jgi:SAM-dependent methyltransferase
VKQHWERLAEEHRTGLEATTKTPTIKALEIAALARALRAAGLDEKRGAVVLEVGCGNGRNCIDLANKFPGARFTGVDYVPQMIESARAAAGARPLAFEVGDALEIDRHPALLPEYDVVFTDRCVINLMTSEEQLRTLDQLTAKVRIGGALVLLENTRQAFEAQNDLREAARLPRRTPPEHNRFIDEEAFLEAARERLELVAVDEFAALHDLVLYVLVPAANGGTVDYGHPVVEAATRLLLARPGAGKVTSAGQNRLFHFVRRA